MKTRLASVEDLQANVGELLGVSEWKEMPFSRIQAFADVTGDQQWIHVDRERIAAESPFGVPIAHGYFTLSLVAGLFFEVLELEGFKLVINYGCNKVRFPNPLKEDARYRLSLTLQSTRQIKEWWEIVFAATIEIEGERKPACFAEVVYRLLPA